MREYLAWKAPNIGSSGAGISDWGKTNHLSEIHLSGAPRQAYDEDEAITGNQSRSRPYD